MLGRLKNAVPELLLEEWMQALVRRRQSHPEQDTILDLCAGYQSLKPFAMKYGFNYIAVDTLGDRNVRRRAVTPTTASP